MKNSINKIDEYACKLQRLYFDHERFFDKFNADDFDSLDNASGSGGMYDVAWFVNNHDYPEASKYLAYTRDWWKMINDKCRRRGWDYNAAQRGFDTTSPLATVWTYSSLALIEIEKISDSLKKHCK